MDETLDVTECIQSAYDFEKGQIISIDHSSGTDDSGVYIIKRIEDSSTITIRRPYWWEFKWWAVKDWFWNIFSKVRKIFSGYR